MSGRCIATWAWLICHNSKIIMLESVHLTDKSISQSFPRKGFRFFQFFSFLYRVSLQKCAKHKNSTSKNLVKRDQWTLNSLSFNGLFVSTFSVFVISKPKRGAKMGCRNTQACHKFVNTNVFRQESPKFVLQEKQVALYVNSDMKFEMSDTGRKKGV